jgi:hypothetical protein
MPFAQYLAYRDRNQTLSDLSAFQAVNVNMRIGEVPESAFAFAVTGNYFTGMGVPAAFGRTLGQIDDEPGAGAAAMLSEGFWRRRFGSDPEIVGRTLNINGTVFTVVGVTPASFTGTMEPMRPPLWLSWAGLDAGISLTAVAALNQAGSISLVPIQIAAMLAGALGVVALILGAIGLYGVVSYLARQRIREIGIRMALGASPSGVVGLITRQALSWTGLGLGVGLLAAVGAGQLLTSLIYGVSPADPFAFVGVPLLLFLTAYLACWFPARRASRRDPLSALREE